MNERCGIRPSEQFAVSFFAIYLFKEETNECCSRVCFVIFELNLLNLKRVKDL